MNDKNTFSEKLDAFLSGKGFYIVLATCAAVIGLSAWGLISAGVFNGTEPAADVPLNSQVSVPKTNGVINNPAADTNKGGSTVSVWNEKDNSTTKTPDVSDVSEPPKEEKPAALTYAMPLKGDIITSYSMEELQYDKTMDDWRVHSGIDISATIGDRVCAVADGTVKEVYKDDLLGTTVIISHSDGTESIYANLAATPTVAVGDEVRGGDIIGSVGDTALAETGIAQHLHFAMRAGEKYIDPAEKIKY